MSEKLEELISLLYQDKLTQYGKRLLVENIEKLQKENEELKEDRDKFKKALGRRITYCNELEKDLFENGSNYVIPKSKVKEKIEELKNGTYDAKIILQQLLREE